tara:strand:- start:196 stop:465 length:270 start_codon:yes stop_codon:yes gene_type:complete
MSTSITNPDRDLLQKRFLIVGMLSELGEYGMRMTRNINPFTFAKQFYKITRRTKYDKFIQYIDFLYQDDIISEDELKEYSIKAYQRIMD